MTDTTTRGFMESAEDSLSSARNASREKRWAKTVRESQMTVELAVKAALFAVGVPVKKRHDVSQVLMDNVPRFPHGFGSRVHEWATANAELDRLREIAVYPDPGTGMTPRTRFFDPAEAERCLKEAEAVYAQVNELFVQLDAKQAAADQKALHRE